jgi:CBS domain-containing protein
MKVKDIMTKNVITVKPETTLKELAKIIKTHRINGVPVVDEGDTLVGIVTMTDMLKILRDIYYWAEIEKAKPGLGVKDALIEEKNNATVQTKMTTGVYTVSEEESVEDVVEIMCKRNIHTIPVVKEKKLIGVIGATDIVNIFV